MPRDLTPKQRATWWVWFGILFNWHPCDAKYAAFADVCGWTVTLSDTPPTWRPEQ